MIWSPRPVWQDDARCLGYPSELFYGFHRERPKLQERRETAALEVCAECPVSDQCRDAGRDEPFGIWGGTTAEDRGFNRQGSRIGAPRGPQPGQPTPLIHGTSGGYHKHKREGTEPCADCRHANSEYARHRRAQRRLAVAS